MRCRLSGARQKSSRAEALGLQFAIQPCNLHGASLRDGRKSIRSSRARMARGLQIEQRMDFVSLALMASFFALSRGLLALCERLHRS